VIASTICRLNELGYLDDAEYARRRAFLLAERGYGDYAIVASLKVMGFGEEDALSALSSLPEGFSERARLERVVGKKSGLDRARLIRHLMSRGFPLDLILDVTNGVDQ
jgi:SOS response regulatory protein OraA/RecX